MRRIAIFFAVLSAAAVAPAADAQSVPQSARQIPVVGQADVLVVGGTLGGVAAAVEASRAGAEVWLVAPRTYLGEDLCATLWLWQDANESAAGELTRAIFGQQPTTTPLRVKKTLEAALLDAHVRFLFGSFPTDVLLDEAGHPAAVIIANRSGRQAIRAKVIVDATERGTVARMAGASVAGTPGAIHTARRVVLGGEPASSLEPVCSIAAGVEHQGDEPRYHQYDLELDAGDGTFSCLAEAEQQGRDLTYRHGQLRAAERLRIVWQQHLVGQRSADQWNAETPPSLGHFQPRGLERLFVLGSAADVPREAAERLMEPAASEALGRRIGVAAAERARAVPFSSFPRSRVGTSAPEASPSSADAAPSAGDTATSGGTARTNDRSHAERGDGTTPGGDIRETLSGLRPIGQADSTILLPAGSVPVWARVDVVVVGGGTSGACAAIGAARQGARVLVIEYQEGLGGVGTVGLITRPYHGRNEGFTREVPFPDKQQNVEDKMEWYRREIRQAGGQIWLGALGCGAYVQGDRVCGAVVATTEGRGVVLAGVVIDATSNGDVAVAAGAGSMYGGDPEDIALQGTGLPMRPLGASYVNTDYLLVDEADALDTWRALVGVRLASDPAVYDVGTLIQNRERRRVAGDHVLAYLDQIAGRTYPDSIVLSASDYDTHGYPSDLYFALIPHTDQTRQANHPAPGGTCYTPYRCLLPRGLDGILVTGLGISMHRDASAMIRMQRDLHNQGYAAGVAAAMAVRDGCTPREIDVRQLQAHLVEIGNLPASVLTDVDSFPLSPSAIQDAVAALGDERRSRDEVCRALAVVLSHERQAKPLLQSAFAAAEGPARLEYAKVLGVLGEREVVPLLIEALDQIDVWDDKILQGKMAEYAHLPTPIDALILALGSTRDPRGVPAILRKLAMLDAGVTLSHHRAVALALEQIGDPAAAPLLARLLNEPGMRGHAMRELEPLYDRERERRRREGPLREIVLARALYRCGDHQGLGAQILQEYREDLRGLFARHAQAVLAAGAEGAGP